jgi:hypothetical protein
MKLKFLPKAVWHGDGAEGAVLRLVFFALVSASVVMLGLDLNAMIARAGDPAESDRTDPVVTEPPRDTDQERPYFPKAMPIAPRGAPPAMPGVERVTPKMTGERMTFSTNADGDVTAIGRIEPGTAAEFDKVLSGASGKAKRVWLHSPGGVLGEALTMGRAIRKAKLSTVVPPNAYCASSCPLVFAGGVEREAGKKSWIGVHQVYTAPTEVGTLQDGLENAQRISADCQEHLVEMGVDARAWVFAMRTSKTKLYIFTPEELTKLRWTTKAPTS